MRHQDAHARGRDCRLCGVFGFIRVRASRQTGGPEPKDLSIGTASRRQNPHLPGASCGTDTKAQKLLGKARGGPPTPRGPRQRGPQGSVALAQPGCSGSLSITENQPKRRHQSASRGSPSSRAGTSSLARGTPGYLPLSRYPGDPCRARARQPRGSPLQGRKVTMSSAVTVVSMSDSGDMDAPKYKSPRPDATPPASIKPDADVAARFRAASPRRGAGREATPRTASSRRRPRRRRCRSRRRAGRRGAARPRHRRTTTRRLETSSTP